MKRLFLISASLMMASASFAQSDNTLYKFNNTGSAKEVRKLGTAPEFPFLRNMKSSAQVYAAIKRHSGDNSAAMDKLDDLLMQIGYANGTKDLQASDITEAYVKPGTEGNMGSRGYTYGYYRLEGSPSEFKAWKIAANKDGNNNGYGSLYIFSKCGNAFFPKSAATTACVNVPVNLTADMQQINLNNSGSVVTNKDQVFVYYSRKRAKRHQAMNTNPDISDKYISNPILVNSEKNMDVKPETYTVTLSSPQNTVSACADSTLNLTANINVEKTSSYTGNYPDSDHKQYKKVSKRSYKMIARRMRRVHRKEEKIARKTNLKVDVSTDRA